jgi:ribonuclease G
MAKELFVCSSPHETKVAVFEDDQLVEVYYERESDVGLVGSIYKGRVNRVLPGMQSAFVNIGLERDAFLYVSDFVEDEEEYDKIFSEAEARATRYVETAQVAPSETAAPAPPPTSAGAERTEASAAAASVPPAAPEPVRAAPPTPARPAGDQYEYRRHDRDHRHRRRGRRGRDSRFPSAPETHQRPPEHTFEVLPGESLAKYREAGAPGGEAPPAELYPTETQAAVPAELAEPMGIPTTSLSEISAPVEATVTTPEPVPAPEAFPEPALPEETKAALVPQTPAAETLEAEQETESTIVFAPVNIYTPGNAQPPEPPAAPPAIEGLEAPSRAAGGVEPEPTGEPSAGVDTMALPSESPEANVEPETEGFAQEGLEAAVEGEEPEVELATATELGVTEGPETAVETTPEAGTTAESAPASTPASETEPGEKKYTLREPYQRPRFAPRRRRGRRGMGRVRPERHEPSRPGNNQAVQISDLLKEGQEIIVQIAKEPLGTKGARITSHIALPGRYLVFMPTIDHIGVSRKISSEDERLRLRNIILENRGSLTGGFIVRTAGAGRSEDEFKADLRFLSTLWNEIRAKAERTKAPVLLHRDLDLVQRILRDILSPDFKQVRVDNELEYERCVEFVNRCQPSLVGHVKLYTRSTPMFEEFGIQQEVDKALKPKVWLKSGGYIVINQTEALVAIDVNTGKYVGKTNRLEDTIVKTNIDAVNEIVRQIRLRDLGGIIVIDFIDMDERKNRLKVVQALEEALRRDRAPTKILSFNDFGLVALTRKRVKQSLERTISQPCTYCSGSGWIKSVTTVCYEIVGEVKKMAKQLEGDSVTLRVSPEVAHALKSRQGALLSELEALTHKDIIVKGDPTVHQERFEIY